MSTVSNLSDDLLSEILVRSSVKSIIRSKCVCKLWLKVVTNPRFPKFHLIHSKTKNPNLILISNLYRDFHSLDCNSFEKALTLNPTLPHEPGISIVGSCNGLICLSDLKTFVSIWNPAINECVELPFDPVRVPEGGNRSSVVMGFGYDSVTDEYKVLKVVFYFDIHKVTQFDSCEMKVYTLGTNSWRAIGNSPACYIGNLSRVAHVNGILHWVGIRGMMGIQAVRSIICFSVKDEKFGEVPWPEFDDSDCRDVRLGVLDDCFSVFCYFMEHVDIWVMQDYGVKDSWRKLFSVKRPTKFLEPLAVQNNGEIVLQMGHKTLVLYDPVSRSTRIPSVHGIPDRFRSGVYVESLISVALIMGRDSERKQE